MKKDLNSYIAHNAQYEVNDITEKNTLNTIKKYDALQLYERQGFVSAIEKFSHRKLHIDIGSGTGWLLRKTAPVFEKVIGIEPSKTATQASSKALSQYSNIEYINEDMVDALKVINITEPAFFTSAIVFSHIKNFHVTNFLNELDNAPAGSTLYFFENYDTNIQHPFWYIRNKEWWAKRLPNWQLTFFDLQNDEYKAGIYGINVGRQNVTNTYALSFSRKIIWTISGWINLSKKALKKLNLFKKKA